MQLLLRHSLQQFAHGTLLLFRKLERQRFAKPRKMRAVGAVRCRLRVLCGIARAHEQMELQHEQFFVSKTAASRLNVLHMVRLVHGPASLPDGSAAIFHAQLQRKRIVHAFAQIERGRDQTTNLRRRHAFGGRVHGNDHADRRGPFLKGLKERIRHSFEAVIELHLAGNGKGIPRMQAIGQPRLPKARDHQDARRGRRP